MRKIPKAILVVLMLLSLLTAFLAGFYIAQNIFNNSSKELDAFNTFYRYEAARNIAILLKTGKVKDAKCEADLEASSGLDYVKSCIANKQCNLFIRSEVNDRAPEAIGNRPLGFDYLQSKGGVRRCEYTENSYSVN